MTNISFSKVPFVEVAWQFSFFVFFVNNTIFCFKSNKVWMGTPLEIYTYKVKKSLKLIRILTYWTLSQKPTIFLFFAYRCFICEISILLIASQCRDNKEEFWNRRKNEQSAKCGGTAPPCFCYPAGDTGRVLYLTRFFFLSFFWQHF